MGTAGGAAEGVVADRRPARPGRASPRAGLRGLPASWLPGSWTLLQQPQQWGDPPAGPLGADCARRVTSAELHALLSHSEVMKVRAGVPGPRRLLILDLLPREFRWFIMKHRYALGSFRRGHRGSLLQVYVLNAFLFATFAISLETRWPRARHCSSRSRFSGLLINL